MLQLELQWGLLGQHIALLLSTALQVPLWEEEQEWVRCGTTSLKGLKTTAIHIPPKLSRKNRPQEKRVCVPALG